MSGLTPNMGWPYPWQVDLFQRHWIQDLAAAIEVDLNAHDAARLDALNRLKGTLYSTQLGGPANQSVNVVVGTPQFIPFGYSYGQVIVPPVTAQTLPAGVYRVGGVVTAGSTGGLTTIEARLETGAGGIIYSRKLPAAETSVRLNGPIYLAATTTIRLSMLTTGTPAVSVVATGSLQWARIALP